MSFSSTYHSIVVLENSIQAFSKSSLTIMSSCDGVEIVVISSIKVFAVFFSNAWVFYGRDGAGAGVFYEG